jgi:hypothetical protein
VQNRSNLRNGRLGSLRYAIHMLRGLIVLMLAGALGNGASAATASTNAGSIVKPSGPDLSRLEVAHAVMVTVELDFGPKVPSIAQAIQQVERRYEPEDGSTGRTFAILDAYGEPTPDGKLHMSMHVSTEKPGGASLVFKRTGEVLWHSQIVKGTNTPAALANRGLVILLDNGAGRTVTVDGSNNPRSVLEAKVKEMNATIGDIWPEGAEREVTFLYSACGCPVKVMAMRVGDRTVRTRNLPVIFPDDPAVVGVIKRVMRWDS